MFCPDCGTWNRALAASCSRCSMGLPEVAGTPIERPDDEISALRRATGSRYRILRRLGGGGMATVFRAEQMPLGREVVRVRDMVERLKSDRSLLRVEDVAEALDLDVRSLQRRFRRYVGVSPKWVIQRRNAWPPGRL